jgi:amidase
MVRDLPAYLDAWAPPAVPVSSLAEIKAFNEQAASQRMPYGQALVDGMAAFETSFAGQPVLLAERTEALRAVVVGETGGYLQRLFEDNSLDALVRINNSGASAGAFANFPALTMPVGYRDSGQPIGVTLYAPSFQEQRLVDLGAVLEAAGSLRVPPSF